MRVGVLAPLKVAHYRKPWIGQSTASIVIAGVAVEHLSMPLVILAVGAIVALAAVWDWTRSNLRRV